MLAKRRAENPGGTIVGNARWLSDRHMIDQLDAALKEAGIANE